jgi:muramoyltetrapeptide carboxypeptidase
MTLAPQFLKKGDKVILLSTARKMSVEDIQTAKSLIESWGLQVELGETIGAEHHQYAGDDALRLNDFQRAIDNDSIRAIFCARGGYGTVRFLDQIDFSKFLRSPKWLVGFSDVTYSAHAHQPPTRRSNTSRQHALIVLENGRCSYTRYW